MEDNKQRPVPRPGNDNPGQRKGPRFNIYWIYGLILLAVIGVQFLGNNFNAPDKAMSFQDFKTNVLDKGNVEKLVVVNNDFVKVFLK